MAEDVVLVDRQLVRGALGLLWSAQVTGHYYPVPHRGLVVGGDITRCQDQRCIDISRVQADLQAALDAPVQRDDVVLAYRATVASYEKDFTRLKARVAELEKHEEELEDRCTGYEQEIESLYNAQEIEPAMTEVLSDPEPLVQMTVSSLRLSDLKRFTGLLERGLAQNPGDV